MNPRIGLTAATSDGSDPSPWARRQVVGQAYLTWLESRGAAPLVLPNVGPELVETLLEGLDGLLLTGGDDIQPLLFEQEPHPQLGGVDVPRDRFELPLIRRALELELPILGICRGIQALNVAAGGTLVQDVPSAPGTKVQHRMKTSGGPTTHHTIVVEPDSRLARVLGLAQTAVNSYHHQAVDRLGDGLRVAARTTDQVIEAIEGVGERFVLGLQWHPEVMPLDDPVSGALFDAFVEACRHHAEAVRLGSPLAGAAD